jgi:hypothetical protein
VIVREQRGYGPVEAGGAVMLPPCCTTTVPDPDVPIVLVVALVLVSVDIVSLMVESGIGAVVVVDAGGVVVEVAGGGPIVSRSPIVVPGCMVASEPIGWPASRGSACAKATPLIISAEANKMLFITVSSLRTGRPPASKPRAQAR